jgi:hypothetical protein
MCPPAEFVEPINATKNAIGRVGPLPSVTRRERPVPAQGQPRETIFCAETEGALRVGADSSKGSPALVGRIVDWKRSPWAVRPLAPTATKLERTYNTRNKG